LTYFPFLAMKRFLYSSVSMALGLSIAAPGMAYFAVPGNDGTNGVQRQSRRQIIRRAEAVNRLPNYIPTEDRSRGAAVTNKNVGHNLLRRADGRRFRRYNRTRKPGFDRYRTLNLRSNKRSLRGMEYESNLSLPRTLVQTGGYSRPARRDIRNDRDRDILQEMSESSR
jgi:hypothetical protein